LNASINSLVSFLPRGDSTRLEIDAIVNAANPLLAPGGGICGAIFRVAGPRLDAACRATGSCAAAVTPGFGLPARFVIHAAGPVGERPQMLSSVYSAILALIDGKAIRSVGICCLATGIFGYPVNRATVIALKTVRQWLENGGNQAKVDRIVFVVCQTKDVDVYEEMLPT
jgi:O-acetyl-ADP-ribose deacetylase (regulator of RNase III)